MKPRKTCDMIFVIVIGTKSGTRRLARTKPELPCSTLVCIPSRLSSSFPSSPLFSSSLLVSTSFVASFYTLPPIPPFPPKGISPVMSSTAHFPDAEGFQQQSDNFMSWLQASPGVQLNPKLRLADLRATGAGRGVGKCPKNIFPKHTKASTESPKVKVS